MAPCIVAIDGYAACGKSTLAKQLAIELDCLYVDTGAMYRSIALYFMRYLIAWDDNENITKHLPDIRIDYIKRNKQQRIMLNEEDVTDLIRSVEVNKSVSSYAKQALIRNYATKMQQSFQYKTEHGIIMEGRDIGTVVFPEAQVKFFLLADIGVRAQRRYEELKQLDSEKLTLQSVQQNLIERDTIDEGREHSPLKQAPDAYEIDNTHLTLEEQKQKALLIIKRRCCNQW